MRRSHDVRVSSRPAFANARTKGTWFCLMARSRKVLLGPLEPYPRMTHTGVEWLGESPHHWRVQRLKSLLSNVMEQGADRRPEDIYLALEHVEAHTGRMNPDTASAPSESQLKRFEGGDVLFGKLRPYLAKVVQPTAGGLCVGEFLVLRPRRHGRAAGSYMAALLRSKPFIDAVIRLTQGAQMPRAEWSFLANLPVILPAFTEQTAIARFLDYIDQRIQACIATKERLLALLEECRHTLIHRAVTGQIDVRTGERYPAYKQSKVEWLGRVPKHWPLVRLKGVVENVVEQGTEPRPEDAYVALEHVEGWTGRITVVLTPPPPGGQTKRFEGGDVLFGKLRPYLAKVAMPLVAGLCVGEFFVLRPRHPDGPEASYLSYLMRSKPLIGALDSMTQGAQMPRVGWDSFGSLKAAFPPFPEQVAIIRFLDRETARIASAIASTRREIGVIQEYRARLIADVVTGKLDVRGIVAKLPGGSGRRRTRGGGPSA